MKFKVAVEREGDRRWIAEVDELSGVQALQRALATSPTEGRITVHDAR